MPAFGDELVDHRDLFIGRGLRVETNYFVTFKEAIHLRQICSDPFRLSHSLRFPAVRLSHARPLCAHGRIKSRTVLVFVDIKDTTSPVDEVMSRSGEFREVRAGAYPSMGVIIMGIKLWRSLGSYEELLLPCRVVRVRSVTTIDGDEL